MVSVATKTGSPPAPAPIIARPPMIRRLFSGPLARALQVRMQGTPSLVGADLIRICGRRRALLVPFVLRGCRELHLSTVVTSLLNN